MSLLISHSQIEVGLLHSAADLFDHAHSPWPRQADCLDKTDIITINWHKQADIKIAHLAHMIRITLFAISTQVMWLWLFLQTQSLFQLFRCWGLSVTAELLWKWGSRLISKWGAENTFFSVALYNFQKKVGGGTEAPPPPPLPPLQSLFIHTNIHTYIRHSNPSIFPESPVFWRILPVSWFLSKSPGFWNNSKINVQVIETHVGFSDTCGNGLINLSFESFSNCGSRPVSFRNSLPQSSFRGPSSRPVVLQKKLFSMLLPRAHVDFACMINYFRRHCQ